MESLHAPWRIEYILAPKPEPSTRLFTEMAQSSDDVAGGRSSRPTIQPTRGIKLARPASRAR